MQHPSRRWSSDSPRTPEDFSPREDLEALSVEPVSAGPVRLPRVGLPPEPPQHRSTLRDPSEMAPATAAALASLKEFESGPRAELAVDRAADAAPPPVRTPSAANSRAQSFAGPEPTAATLDVPLPDAEYNQLDPTVSEGAARARVDSTIRAVERKRLPPASLLRGGWFGWAAAGVLIVIGGAFYVLRYAPLIQKLESVKRESAQQLLRSTAAMDRLSSELEQKRGELERSRLTAANAAHPVETPWVDAPKPRDHGRAGTTRPSEPQAEHEQYRAATRATPEAKRAEPVSDRTEPAANGVDLAAASAATAALEAEAYGSKSSPTRESEAEAQPVKPDPVRAESLKAEPVNPEPRAPQDTLSGVLDESNDPLKGL